MCSHKINAILHCLINFNASLFFAFTVALCCKVAIGCKGGSAEPVEKIHAVVLHCCTSPSSVVALSSAQVPL